MWNSRLPSHSLRSVRVLTAYLLGVMSGLGLAALIMIVVLAAVVMESGPARAEVLPPALAEWGPVATMTSTLTGTPFPIAIFTPGLTATSTPTEILPPTPTQFWPLAAAAAEQVLPNGSPFPAQELMATCNTFERGEMTARRESGAVALASEARGRFPQKIERWRPLVESTVGCDQIMVDVLLAQIEVESGGHADYYGAAGEVGLLQVLPADNAVRPELSNPARPAAYALLDPSVNVQSGYAYLLECIGEMGNVFDGLRCYNAGANGARGGGGFYYTYRVLSRLFAAHVELTQ